jgi:hypothetical protein
MHSGNEDDEFCSVRSNQTSYKNNQIVRVRFDVIRENRINSIKFTSIRSEIRFNFDSFTVIISGLRMNYICIHYNLQNWSFTYGKCERLIVHDHLHLLQFKIRTCA